MNKKKSPKSVKIQQSHSLCGHIQTLFANFEIMKELFPDYFGSSCNTTEDSDDTNYDLTFASTCDINTQDEYIDETTHEDSEHFNTITGMWEFGGKSQHMPKEMNDLQLSRFDFLFTSKTLMTSSHHNIASKELSIRNL